MYIILYTRAYSSLYICLYILFSGFVDCGEVCPPPYSFLLISSFFFCIYVFRFGFFIIGWLCFLVRSQLLIMYINIFVYIYINTYKYFDFFLPHFIVRTLA